MEKKILISILKHTKESETSYGKLQQAIRVTNEALESVLNKLESEKLIVRNRSKMPLCEGCLRITVGTEVENKMLIDRLTEYHEVISNIK